MEIKTIDGTILYTCDCKTIADALAAAVKSGANLYNANLYNADLGGADLGGAKLRGAYLGDADLRGSDLGDADLVGANLRGAKLGGAYLRDSNLRDSDLRGADLGGANLRGADLGGANLRGANLRDAYLRGANLRDANLRDSDLRDSDLRGSDLRGSDLCGSNLRDSKNIPYIPLSCPSDGEFTAWKKVSDGDPWLVELRIPADARRSSATTNKCRCDKALVVAITSIDGKKSKEYVINKTYVTTSYKVGEMVYPNSFDEDRWKECSNGIHFFINKQDAINY